MMANQPSEKRSQGQPEARPSRQLLATAARNLNALVTARFIFCISAVKFGILTGSL